ncbi:zinc finger CCCH domain-containing protein 15-like [Amphiura filiformis]|uniref:zinc finger CCCH domain-containing protein 15-like n=1 Tax=Amphiura filiformis TaxID=82378 RepID=UPI003B20BD57
MPPKKQQKGPSAKTDQKKKDKVVEDKTFGLKNKKGNKQQTYIKSVQSQVKYGNQKASKVREMEENKYKGKKDAKKKEQDELNALFRPAQRVSKGADPKSVVCAFFKQGSCGKGDKCKFSHDLTIERKAEKRNMYADRGEDDEMNKDTMDSWDEDKLQEVVTKKHAEADKQKNQKTSTDIVCKHFIQAIEEYKYGWFWACPNGGDKCMYKHALPPGFVLKRDKKKMDDQAAEQASISLEELVEDERARLSSKNLTKITLESFNAWKARKLKEKKSKYTADQKKKKDELKAGKSLGVTGRELFSFRPELVDLDDADADDVVTYVREEEEEKDDGPVVDLTFENLAAAAREADNSGTVSTSSKREGDTSASGAAQRVGGERSADNPAGVDEAGESKKLNEAAALPASEVNGAAAAAEGGLVNGIQVDENLFAGEVEVDENLFDAELDELDEDLENIDLE